MPTVGLDTRYFYPQPVNELRQQLGLCGQATVGYVGRLVPEKGVDTLLQAVPRFPPSVRCLIIGDGPEKTNLEAIARQPGIAERCSFIGGLSYDRMPAYMNLLDILVLPSRTTRNWKEQFGRVLVEAMGCQITVVGSNSGAIPEVIGDAGRLFPEGNAASLAAVVNDLLADPQLRRALGERGYRRALERYSVERLAAQTLTLWQKLNLA